jgi:HNH endonuclease
MALSKRLRYEVLRRDNHTCRYCGAAAPDVKLTVDHVIPSALGGRDGPENLVAACRDCNAGKTSTSPDAHLVADVAQDAIRWALARRRASESMADEVLARRHVVNETCAFWGDTWASWNEAPPVPHDWADSIDHWLELGLHKHVIWQLMLIVEERAERLSWPGIWRYFAGCCWKKIRELDDATEALLGADA